MSLLFLVLTALSAVLREQVRKPMVRYVGAGRSDSERQEGRMCMR